MFQISKKIQLRKFSSLALSVGAILIFSEGVFAACPPGEIELEAGCVPVRSGANIGSDRQGALDNASSEIDVDALNQRNMQSLEQQSREFSEKFGREMRGQNQGPICDENQNCGGTASTGGAAAPGTSSTGLDTETAAETSCLDAAESARAMCDPNSGVDAVAQLFIQMAAQKQASDINSMCKGAKKTSMLMGALQATRAGLCKVRQSKCMATCEADEKNPSAVQTTTMKRALRKCQGYEQAFILQVLQTLQYANSYMQANNCAKATATDTVPVVPTGLGEVDCAIAANAGNLTCVCQVNARDPRCTYGNAIGSGSLFGNSGTTGGGRNPARLDGSGGGIGDGDGSGGDDIDPVASTKGAGTNGIGGGGGGGPSGGSGSGFGSGGDPAAGAPAGSGFKTDVVSGVGSGSGGPGGGGNRGGGGGSGSGGGDGGLGKLKGLLNIKDALPDKDKLARGLAGMSGDAANDGITGKMGESLFQKATRQYRSQQRSCWFLPCK